MLEKITDFALNYAPAICVLIALCQLIVFFVKKLNRQSEYPDELRIYRIGFVSLVVVFIGLVPFFHLSGVYKIIDYIIIYVAFACFVIDCIYYLIKAKQGKVSGDYDGVIFCWTFAILGTIILVLVGIAFVLLFLNI